MTDLSTPLSREEMVTYISFIDDNTQKTTELAKQSFELYTKSINSALLQMSDKLDNLFSELSKAIIQISKGQNAQTDAITKAADMMRKQIFAITSKTDSIKKTEIKNKTNPLFYSTLDNQKQSLWIKKVRGEIANLCLEENKIEGVVYKEIYSSMKQAGYDIDELLREYKSINNKADAISMIAASDALRNSCSNIINKCVHNKIVRQLKKNTKVKTIYNKNKNCLSEKARHTPENVRNIVARMTPDGKPNVGTYRKAYGLLDIDKKAFLQEAREQSGINYMVLGYAIGNDPVMLAKLDKAVSEYIVKRLDNVIENISKRTVVK